MIDFIFTIFFLFSPIVFMGTASVLLWNIFIPPSYRWIDITDSDEIMPLLSIIMISAAITVVEGMGYYACTSSPNTCVPAVEEKGQIVPKSS